MTAETPAAETGNQDSVFGSGYKLFLGIAGALFAIIAITIPMVIIAQSMRSVDSGGPPPAALEPGEQIALDAGCLACHTTDGSDLVGPSWLDLAGSDRPLESGETVVADDAYLEESIIDPEAKVVEGFDPTMPTTYQDTLSAEDIGSIIDFINTLSS